MKIYSLNNKPSKKYTVLTAIFGGYDKLHDPDIIQPNTDYICITDNLNIKTNVFKLIPAPKSIDENWSGRKKTYYVRYHPFEFCNSDYCVWMDASIKINKLNFDDICTKDLIYFSGYSLNDYLNSFCSCVNLKNTYDCQYNYVISVNLLTIFTLLYKKYNTSYNLPEIKSINGCFRCYKNNNIIKNKLATVFNELNNIMVLNNSVIDLNIGKTYVNDILYYDEIISGIILNEIPANKLSFDDIFKNNILLKFNHNTDNTIF